MSYMVVSGGGSGTSTAGDTTYDNSGSNLTVTDVRAALDALANRTGAPIVAVIAGEDADEDVRLSTDYKQSQGADDVEVAVASALTDGFRAFLFVGTCVAGVAVDIDTADEVHLGTTPGASLDGDLTISVTGSIVRLDLEVTGSITDSNARLVRPIRSPNAPNAQTGTAYTLVAPDADGVVTMDNSSANTLTIPADSSVDFDLNTAVFVIQKGTGTTTISGATGVTLRAGTGSVSGGSVDLDGQGAGATLIKIAADDWFVVGGVGNAA